jgi:uncharacterized membrane protein YphA (DoxX/SURF4 family)
MLDTNQLCFTCGSAWCGDPPEFAGRSRSTLAILYTLIVAALALMGGGRFSLDAKLFNPKAAS